MLRISWLHLPSWMWSITNVSRPPGDRPARPCLRTRSCELGKLKARAMTVRPKIASWRCGRLLRFHTGLADDPLVFHALCLRRSRRTASVVCGTTLAPASSSFCRVGGSARILLISLLSRAIDRAGVPRRREEALPEREIEIRNAVASATVGISGAPAARLPDDTASTFTVPAFISGIAAGKPGEIHIDVATEQIVQRGPRALVGHVRELALARSLRNSPAKMARRAGAGGGKRERLLVRSSPSPFPPWWHTAPWREPRARAARPTRARPE